jgi:hypothetical protein
MIKRASWIYGTGQQWKLHVLLFLSTLAIIAALIGMFPQLGPSKLEREYVLIIVAAVIAFWLVWIAIAVRCPRCLAKTGWWFIRHSTPFEWLTAFITTRQCPACGYSTSLDNRGVSREK